MSTTSDVQELYIGLLGRAADPSGLAYWVGEIDAGTLTLEELRSNIVNEQPEYANGLGLDTRAQLVNALYENMFERPAGEVGLTYWVDGAGSTVPADQLVYALSNGAAATDQLTLDNKVEAATYYTANTLQAAYTNAKATASVSDVDGTAASVTASKANTDAGSDAGETFTLTNSTITGTLDNLTGTAYDDTFDASANNFLVTGDVVDGKLGEDTINSRTTATAAVNISASLSNIETHNVRVDHDGAAADVVTYDFSNITGATKVVADRVNNTGAAADSIVTFSGSGFTTAVTTGIKGGDAGANNSSYDVTATYASVTGTSDAATLELNGAAANVVTIAGIETLTISGVTTETSISATGASQLNSLQAVDATTVNVTGAGAVTLSGNKGSTTEVAANFGATVAVNASASTGGVTFRSEANTLTFTGGTGSDSVYMAGTTTLADTLTGGAGTGVDTIGITTATTAANAVGISGFENIDISGAGAVTIDLALFTNNTTFTGINVTEETGTVTAVNNLDSGGTLTLGGGATVITAASDLTVGITGAGVAGHNSDVLNVAVTGTVAVDYGTLVVANTETINIASGGLATGNSIAVLTAAAGTDIVLTGDSDLAITAWTGSTFTNINASAMTGDFVMGAANAATTAAAIKGGSGADTLIGNTGNDVITDGTGIDTITGAAGGDDITVTAGNNDTVVLITGATITALSIAASATSLTATVANGDTMTFGNGVDLIRGFVSAADNFSVSAATVAFEATAPTAIIGQTENNITEDTIFASRGDYVESTGVWTFSATGADTLMAINDGTAADDVLSTNTNLTVVIGVTALVAGDFI
jgi:hypothetical protein